MLKSYLFHIGVAAVLLSTALQSCKKTDGVNNNQVIETPYGIYYADSTGALYNTNDGTNIKPMVFPPDGFPTKAIAISGNNILWAKINLQVSTNNGMNFDSTFTRINPKAITASCIYNSVDENRVYVSAAPGMGRMGVYYSDQNGARKSWVEDKSYASSITGTVTITSFTELQNNTLIGYDATQNRVFAKKSKTDSWTETTVTPLPAGANFSISHLINTVVAIDYNGTKGAYYSTDNGGHWTAYAGLPLNRRLFSVAAPFDQVLLIGTDSSGIYRLNSSGIFEPSNNGLGTYTVVSGIVGKENIYKDVTAPQQYIFIATNQGMFRSNDLGVNWALAQPGNIVAIY